jgi:hypothetical protein
LRDDRRRGGRRLAAIRQVMARRRPLVRPTFPPTSPSLARVAATGKVRVVGASWPRRRNVGTGATCVAAIRQVMTSGKRLAVATRARGRW